MSNLLNRAVNYLSGADGDSFVGCTIDMETHKLNIRGVLGDGGFGKVYKVASLRDGSEFALKRLFVPEESMKQIQQELTLLRKVAGHPNICTFVSGAAHPVPERRGFAEYLILLEFCPGSLVELIKASGSKLFTSPEVLRLFYGVCQAVKYLHSFNPPIIHRDIKAENVILSKTGVVKVCDFGSATTVTVRPTEDWTAHQRGMLEEEVNMMTTPCYRSPEMIDYYSNLEIGPKADVWALGCFLYYISYFELPFDDNRLAIVNAKFKPPNEHLVMFTPFIPILRSVFKVNPDTRPTAAQILSLLDNIGKEKGVDPNKPPFEDFRSRQATLNKSPVPPSATPTDHLQANNRSSWIGYLKGGAESILKEAKSASEKVVGAVVQASSLYNNDKLDEGQLQILAVTSRIVAISFPDPGTLETVDEMIRTRYGNSAYFINLSENEYFKESFGGRILNAGWSTQHPPPISSLCHVMEVMDRWLLVAPENILIVHCSTGTGNTPLLICSYLLTCGLYQSSVSALQFYSTCRYPNTSGIVSPSQKRYVEYVERMLYSPGVEVPSRTVILCNLALSSVPLFSVNRANCKPFLEVFENGKKILSTLREPDVMRTYAVEDGCVDLTINMGVSGDIRIAVFHARNFIGGKMSAIKMFQICFNTAFVDPESDTLKFAKTRLDGISRNASKFPDPFGVVLAVSVQAERTDKDSSYKLSPASLGVSPPVCCSTPEEYNRIISKVPDRGSKRGDRHSSVSSAPPKHLVFEEETEEMEDLTRPTEQDTLINLVSCSMVEDKPTPMSDPMSRKSPAMAENMLVNLLSPVTSSMTSSSSAPNLVDMSSLQETRGPMAPTSDEFASFVSTALPPARPPPPTKGHTREKSINLLDMSSKTIEDDLVQSFDPFVKTKQQTTQPPARPPSTNVAPAVVFDPFGGPTQTAPPAQSLLQPDPFMTPGGPGSRTKNMANHMASPIIPCRLDTSSGANSPVLSRNVSPRASPAPVRKANDPFSEFVIDTKTSQMNFEKPGSLPGSNRTSQSGPPNQRPSLPGPPRPSSQPYNNRPNYFASTHAQGSVFSNENKPWQQPSHAVSNDAFSDLLSGQKFSSTQQNKPQTLQEQRRVELEKTTDPVKLKIIDWTRGKENNIRALLSTLGDVLWDGEDRWPKPGMHLMIDASQVKRMYRNASRVVHPDKQTGTANEDLAKAIQTELNDAYKDFEEAELR